MKKLEKTLRRKLADTPSEQLDQKFWNRFEREFGVPAPRARKKPRIFNVLLPATVTAVLLMVVQMNREYLFNAAHEEKESSAGLEIVMDRELYENLEVFDEMVRLEEQVADLSEEEFASLTGV